MLLVGIKNSGAQSIVAARATGALTTNPCTISNIEGELSKQHRKVPIATAPIIKVVVAIAFLVPIVSQSATDLWTLAIASTVFAALTGWLIGGAVANSAIAWWIWRGRIGLSVLPAELSSTGGLGSLGNLYFRQLVILALILVHVGGWIGIFVFLGPSNAEIDVLRDRWLWIYICLIPLFICIEVIAAVLPV